MLPITWPLGNEKPGPGRAGRTPGEIPHERLDDVVDREGAHPDDGEEAAPHGPRRRSATHQVSSHERNRQTASSPNLVTATIARFGPRRVEVGHREAHADPTRPNSGRRSRARYRRRLRSPRGGRGRGPLETDLSLRRGVSERWPCRQLPQRRLKCPERSVQEIFRDASGKACDRSVAAIRGGTRCAYWSSRTRRGLPPG